MQALQYGRVGEPAEVITTAELPEPEPQAGEVRLRMLRSPIHNHDLSTIRGTYGIRPPLPAIGGTEVLGAVDAVGSGVSLTVGTRVSAMIQGAWAQYVIAPESLCVPMPDALDDNTASQLMAMPLSALVLLDDLRVEPGDWIVQNAANGAVGRVLMRLAQARGINVINLVRRESAASELRAFGAKHVVVTEGNDWAAGVRDIAGGQPIARVIDSVTGPQSIELQRILGRRGEYVIFGGLAAAAMRLDPGLMIFNETIVRGFWMTAWMSRASQAERAAAVRNIFGLALTNELPLPVCAVFSLADGKAAMLAAEQPGRSGKVLLSPGSAPF
ncbi:MAG: zinc-binding dehydrogenase [Vulcanimicrobiaceae bacterium]